MVGVPEADLAEWRSRRGKGGQGSNSGGGNGQPSAKRPKVENVSLTPEQLKAQLEAHKALMSGQAPPPGVLPGQFAGIPPPGFPSGPPPPSFSGPPPPFGQRPPPPSQFYTGPPPGFSPRPPPPAMAGGMPPQAPALPGSASPVPTISPHQQAIKSGAKSRMVYTDTQISPEEKLASTSKYVYRDPDDPAPLQPPPVAAAYSQPPPFAQFPPQQPWQQPHIPQPPPQAQPYYGPPPGWGAQNQSPPMGFASPQFAYHGGSASPYARPPGPSIPPPGISPPHMSPMSPTPPQNAYASPRPPYAGPPPGFNAAPPGSNFPHAQSYPAVAPAGQQPSANADANTAEALSKVNASVGNGGAADREIEAGAMERGAKREREADESIPEPVGETEAAADTPATNGRKAGRARAADLF